MAKLDNQAVATSQPQFRDNLAFAQEMDENDPLRKYRAMFHIPHCGTTHETIYFAGNSLGPEPKTARKYIEEELDDWATLGVEGHFEARHPWLPYHEFVTDMSARLVGARPLEVVVMNTLTVNLHLMLVSFYRPTRSKYKVMIEANAFPSDQYAVQSQLKFHGFDPEEALIEAQPRLTEDTLRTDDIVSLIEQNADRLALILLGDVNYLTGQAFDIARIAQAAQNHNVMIGLNLAHGAGNLLLQLHDWNVDFAVWCSYKYLNAGPGGLAGCFVHERHANSFDLPRFAGWWGHRKETRFKMGPRFEPMPGAEGWQISNPPIFQLAALRASLEIFDEATMPSLRQKSELLTGYLEYLLDQIGSNHYQIITPRTPSERGAQLSIRVHGNARHVLEQLKKQGAVCDFREPDIVRATPAPLYCRFQDVYNFAQIMKVCAQEIESKP